MGLFIEIVAEYPEPNAERIATGKAHKRYEFGCEVRVAATSKGGWFVGAQALHGKRLPQRFELYDNRPMNPDFEAFCLKANANGPISPDGNRPLSATETGTLKPKLPRVAKGESSTPVYARAMPFEPAFINRCTKSS